MTLVRGMILGIAGTLALVFVEVTAAVTLGYMPMRADSAPSALEANVAMTAVHALSEREMGHVSNPLPLSAVNLAAGMHVYEQNCVMCHGSSDGKASNPALGFYVPAPQFATEGVEDDPEGATVWKIRHGIRYTAMPAFGKSLSDQQIWQVTMLLNHLDKLPSGAALAWRALPSAAATDSHAATAHQPGMVMR